MPVDAWISYGITVLILTLTPGPTVLLIIALSMAHGAPKGVTAMLGNLTCNLVHITLAVLGVGLLMKQNPALFFWMKWAGAAWIFHMGLSMLRSAPDGATTPDKGPAPTFFQLWWKAFGTSFTNPKSIVFFAAFFPLFLERAVLPSHVVAVQLGLVFILINGCVLSGYALLAGRAASALEGEGGIRRRTRLSGAALMVAAFLLALTSKAA